MDILRKELNNIYAAQRLGDETLPDRAVGEVREMAATVVRVNNACAVITDAACDRCYIYAGSFGSLMGFADGSGACIEFGSSDEDEIYNRIHPEDLVDKRLLEYEFFKLAHSLQPDKKTNVKAACRLRMKDTAGNYRYVDNSTQVLRLSPAGKIWLILCCYDLATDQEPGRGIAPRIIDNSTGDVTALSFDSRRSHVLTGREKEILHLIREGKASKQIAAILGISVNTVNRHRQNIIEKLSVGNSIEAITAATAMKLL